MGSSSPKVTIELNPLDRKCWESFRARLRCTSSRVGESDVADLLLLVPDLGILLTRLLRDERVPRRAKAIGLAGVLYLISPLDLLPSLFLGPVGLIDDLIVVALSLSSLLNHTHPDVVRSHWSGQGDALAAIQKVTQWVEQHAVGRTFNRLISFWPQ